MKKDKRGEITNFIKEVKKAIKLDCYDCMGQQVMTDCNNKKCNLFKFRPWNKEYKWPKMSEYKKP